MTTIKPMSRITEAGIIIFTNRDHYLPMIGRTMSRSVMIYTNFVRGGITSNNRYNKENEFIEAANFVRI